MWLVNWTRVWFATSLFSGCLTNFSFTPLLLTIKFYKISLHLVPLGSSPFVHSTWSSSSSKLSSSTNQLWSPTGCMLTEWFASPQHRDHRMLRQNPEVEFCKDEPKPESSGTLVFISLTWITLRSTYTFMNSGYMMHKCFRKIHHIPNW